MTTITGTGMITSTAMIDDLGDQFDNERSSAHVTRATRLGAVAFAHAIERAVVVVLGTSFAVRVRNATLLDLVREFRLKRCAADGAV